MDGKKDKVELAAEEYANNLLSEVASQEPSDKGEPSEIDVHLPPWYDEEKFKSGQRYYSDYLFSMYVSKLCGLLAVLAVPSILKVLINTNRSSSCLTAYRRYVSTVMHDNVWETGKLEPGSKSWRSLRIVRIRHLRVSRIYGKVSQRDLALTQFGFMGLVLIRPKLLGISNPTAEEEEGLVHLWRTIGYMIGLHDRYNICRPTVEETKLACELCLERVYIPAMTNLPEYFHHMAFQLLDGMWSFQPSIDPASFLYFTKNIIGVPGYEYYSFQRIAAKRRQILALKVGSQSSIANGEKNLLEQTTEEIEPVNLLDVPGYKKLNAYSRWMVNIMMYVHSYLLTTYLGRLYFNTQITISMFLIKYFPFLAFWRHGFKMCYVNMFAEDVSEEVTLKLNSELDIF